MDGQKAASENEAVEIVVMAMIAAAIMAMALAGTVVAENLFVRKFVVRACKGGGEHIEPTACHDIKRRGGVIPR